MKSIKSVAVSIYKYTHMFVGAGAIVTSFLDHQALPPKLAAVVVLVSQGLKVANDALVEAKVAAPVASKLLNEAAAVVPAPHPAVSGTAPLAPAVPAPATATPVATPPVVVS